MNRLTRDGTVEPVPRDLILRRERGHGNIHFPCSADHEQDWQPYPVDAYSMFAPKRFDSFPPFLEDLQKVKMRSDFTLNLNLILLFFIGIGILL